MKKQLDWEIAKPDNSQLLSDSAYKNEMNKMKMTIRWERYG